MEALARRVIAVSGGGRSGVVEWPVGEALSLAYHRFDTALALLHDAPGRWWGVVVAALGLAVRTRGGGGAPPTTYEPPGPFP